MHRYNNTPMCRRKLRKPCLKLHVYGECKNKQHKYMVKCLHVHGENANDTIGQFGGGGTSPDAWRKLNSHTNGILTSGDISAYAEKTVRPYSDESNNRDISRCVEKTSVPCPMVRAPLEHLHAHGENKDIRPWLTKPTGRPPRMRRNYCFGYVV